MATVWNKWFGDSQGEPAGEPGPPTPAMEALAAELQDVKRGFAKYQT